MSVLDALLLFTAAAAVVTVTPGLDTALVLRTAIAEGPRRAMLAGAGVSAGVLTWGVLASVGLGAVLAVSDLAYHGLRIAGAAYLLYLGVRLIVRPRRSAGPDGAAAAAGPASGESGARAFSRGLMTNLLNPKVGVFYVTFLPQFVPAGVDVVGFSTLLAGIHAVEGMLWFAALVVATRPLGRLLARPAVIVALDRLTGGVFVAFGLKLALAPRG
jgi:threonine/homoserine/homoserine lactone efflux protein